MSAASAASLSPVDPDHGQRREKGQAAAGFRRPSGSGPERAGFQLEAFSCEPMGRTEDKARSWGVSCVTPTLCWALPKLPAGRPGRSPGPGLDGRAAAAGCIAMRQGGRSGRGTMDPALTFPLHLDGK